MSQGTFTFGLVLLPTACPSCGARGPAPCPTCAREVRPAPRLAPPAGLDGCAPLLAYEGVGRELVARLKYRNARSVLPFLARGMAALAGSEPFDVVTWVPTAPARRRRRGFDQAEVLARAVASGLRSPCRGLLTRRPGPPQTGRSLAERRHGPVFSARPGVPARVLLVDDVVTSGATASAAARALRAGGAREVRMVVAARTPAPWAAAGVPA